MVDTENWVAEAIASQEEHIRRSTSCLGQIGRAHVYREHGHLGTPNSWQECLTCGTTKTLTDYETKTSATR